MARIYVEQFGGWWSFSPDEFEAFLNNEGWHTDDGWDLDDFGRRLKRRPSVVAKRNYPDSVEYWCASNKHRFYRAPMDWGDRKRLQVKREVAEFRYLLDGGLEDFEER